jgi:hypothetical protein
VTDQPALDPVAEPLSHAIRDAFEAGGVVGQRANNALHHVWLEHPLHPVFTDVPIGAVDDGLPPRLPPAMPVMSPAVVFG